MVYIKEAVSNDTSRYGSMVEQLICNQQVVGSSPIIGFNNLIKELSYRNGPSALLFCAATTLVRAKAHSI